MLLGLQLYLLARDLWKREGLALGLWALYGLSAPVLFYAVHLYPELPIALFSTYIYRMVRKGIPLPRRRLLGMGLLLGSFFWFGLKYNMIFWPLLAVCLYYLWKSEPRRARILWLVVPTLAGLGLFYGAVWDMFGTLSPFAIYEGAAGAKQSQAVLQAFLDLPHAARIDSFFDYFLDQRDGLLPYAPLYVFAFLGFAGMVKRARRELIGLRAQLRLLHPPPGILSPGAGPGPDLLDRRNRRGIFPGPAGAAFLQLAFRPGRRRRLRNLRRSSHPPSLSLSGDDP